MAARRRAFIVGYDPLSRESLRGVLEGDLEVVGEARDGLEALSLASPGAVDLIVMDVSTPRLSSVDATGAVLERDPALVIVTLTGSDHAREDEALPAGGLAYLRKSSEFGELAEILLNLGSVEAPPS